MKTTGTNDILGSLSPASLPDRAATYCVDVAKSIYRLVLRRVERTADNVNSEYNLLHWQKILSRQGLEQGQGPRRFSGPAESC